MTNKIVVLQTSKDGSRISVSGLPPEELDELYGDMESEFGESAISATVGPPYTFAISPELSLHLYLRIVDRCEQLGYEIAPD